MATQIQAVVAYGPRIDLGSTVQNRELAGYLADRTGLNEGEILLVLTELRDAVIFFCRAGRGVKLPGLGTFLPSVKLDGRFKLSFRLDPMIRYALNMPGAFIGDIENSQNIGLTLSDLVAMWNSENPGDPIP